MADKRILVSDDEKDIRSLLGLWLRGAGYDVVEAKDGRETLDKVKKGKFDLILLDLIMPGPDPKTLLKGITDQSKGTPIIYLSATMSARIASLEKNFEVELKPPVYGFILKPVEREALLEKIESVLKNKK